jgi:hypothetical protein
VDLVQKIKGGAFHDVADPAYHNIRWLDLLEDLRTKLSYADSVLNLNPQQLKELRVAVAKQGSAVPCV